MHDNAGRAGRNPARHPQVLPLTRVTAQMWGLEQLNHTYAQRRPRRRPLRAIAQWVAVTLGR
jgi:hypothetical protein